MTDRTPGAVSDGGISGPHPPRRSLPIFVAPTAGTELNTLRRQLLPIACWRIDELRFDFDSSFVRPEAAEELTQLAALYRSHDTPPMSVFGHADPTGTDDYNKSLSGRRARAIHALLTRDVDAWEALYAKPLGGDNWGTRSVQWMLTPLGFYAGPVDGRDSRDLQSAVASFQGSDPESGLARDGVAGPKTRKVLFKQYMDAICRDDKAPFLVEKAAFLGQGKDEGGKGDLQGCSDFNPLLVFAIDADRELQKPENRPVRDAANATNRRVLVFLFPPGSVLTEGQWPCPRASESADGCKSQFYADGDKRRHPQDHQRVYPADGTFACRFYDGMARRSPCESARQTLALWLFDKNRQRMPNAPYRIVVGSQVRTGFSDASGFVTEKNVFVPSRAVVEWARGNAFSRDWEIRMEKYGQRQRPKGPEPAFGYRTVLFLDVDDEATEELDAEAGRRLHNLGYPRDASLAANIAAFQADYELPSAAWFDEATKDALFATHVGGVEQPFTPTPEPPPPPEGVEPDQHPTGDDDVRFGDGSSEEEEPA